MVCSICLRSVLLQIGHILAEQSKEEFNLASLQGVWLKLKAQKTCGIATLRLPERWWWKRVKLLQSVQCLTPYLKRTAMLPMLVEDQRGDWLYDFYKLLSTKIIRLDFRVLVWVSVLDYDATNSFWIILWLILLHCIHLYRVGWIYKTFWILTCTGLFLARLESSMCCMF